MLWLTFGWLRVLLDGLDSGLTGVFKTIQATELTASEHQELLETLLSKQGREWTKVKNLKTAQHLA